MERGRRLLTAPSVKNDDFTSLTEKKTTQTFSKESTSNRCATRRRYHNANDVDLCIRKYIAAWNVYCIRWQTLATTRIDELLFFVVVGHLNRCSLCQSERGRKQRMRWCSFALHVLDIIIVSCDNATHQYWINDASNHSTGCTKKNVWYWCRIQTIVVVKKECPIEQWRAETLVQRPIDHIIWTKDSFKLLTTHPIPIIHPPNALNAVPNAVTPPFVPGGTVLPEMIRNGLLFDSIPSSDARVSARLVEWWAMSAQVSADANGCLLKSGFFDQFKLTLSESLRYWTSTIHVMLWL